VLECALVEMDIGNQLRPKPPIVHEVEPEERRKCIVCCGLYCAAFVGASLGAFFIPCTFVTYNEPITTWLGLVNRYGFVPLPFMATTFVHQCIMSQGMWSPRKRQVWDLNWSVMAISIATQYSLIAVGTALSRYVLPRYSRTYRLLLWDYQRYRRTVSNKVVPSPLGTISENLDWLHAAWAVNIYHICWASITMAADQVSKNRYAILYRGMGYSRMCSPRWREWREVKISNSLDMMLVPKPFKRWGNLFTLDEWRTK